MWPLPAWLLAGAALLGAGGVAAWVLLQATVLTIAVAPRDGTEPGLIKAYADALENARASIRLRILPSTTCGRARPPCRTGGPTSRS